MSVIVQIPRSIFELCVCENILIRHMFHDIMVEASLHQRFGSLHSLAACPAKRGANWISSVSLDRGREERASVELHKECLQPNSSALIKHFDQHTQTSAYYSIFQYTTVNMTAYYSRTVQYMTAKYGTGWRLCMWLYNDQVDSHILLQVFLDAENLTALVTRITPWEIVSFPGHMGTRLLESGVALQCRRRTSHTSQADITH